MAHINCLDMQVELGLPCPHTLEFTFSVITLLLGKICVMLVKFVNSVFFLSVSTL